MANLDPDSERAHRMARLAALQRMRDQMRAGNRESMLHSIDKLIEAEATALRKLRESDTEPQA